MITMRSDWWNADSYYPWIDPLVEAAFGAEIDLHWDLYLQTHAHRLQHGPGCEAYPSPPSRAPLWAILAGQMPSPPEIILETGTGIGYSTVLIAEAFPRSRLFTVERDALHRRIAEQTFADAGVADRITIVPSMDEAPIERSDLGIRRRAGGGRPRLIKRTSGCASRSRPLPRRLTSSVRSTPTSKRLTLRLVTNVRAYAQQNATRLHIAETCNVLHLIQLT